ncbi:MAG: hypothetical protein J6B56_01810 [Clostridia bacterium]|nr:hypothetical protein [Clostridia bacterium]
MKKKAEKTEKTKTDKKESELITKESLCAVCTLFCVFALLILCTRSIIFGEIGIAVHAFLTGLLGYLAYPLLFGGLYLSVMSLVGKSLVKDRKTGWFIALALVCAALIVHTATTYSWEAEGYLSQCFDAGKNFPAATVAGWTGGLLVFVLSKLTTKIGALVVLSILTVFFGYLSYIALKRHDPSEAATQTPTTANPVQPVEIPLEQPTQNTRPAQPVQSAGNTYAGGFETDMPQRPAFTLSDEAATGAVSEQRGQVGGAFSPFGTPQGMRAEEKGYERAYEKSREFLFGSTPAENYKRNLIFDPNASVNKRSWEETAQTPVVSEGYSSYTSAYQSSVNRGEDSRPIKIFSDRSDEYVKPSYENTPETPETVEEIEPIKPIEPLNSIYEQPVTPPEPVSYPPIEEEVARRADDELDYKELFSSRNPNIFGNDEEDRDFARETFREPEPESEPDLTRVMDEPRGRGIDIFDEPEEESDRYTLGGDEVETRGRMGFGEPEIEREIEPLETSDRFSDRGLNVAEPEREPEREPELKLESEPVRRAEPLPPPPPPKPRVIRPYKRVPLDDFDCRDVEPTSNMEEVKETKENILATLEDFKVSGASIASVTFGPTVTRYNVTIPRNISPRKVVALDESLAINLRASDVNVYPNYEDGVVSIEVPNKVRQFVQLGCMLTGDTFVNAKSSSLMFTMGKDVANRKVYGDISKMTHLLVAGSSGSGKSVFLGSLIISLIYKYSPEELRLILIDPKKTEFVLYNNLPHLMINEIITDVNKAVQSLNWAIGEMNRRYGLFEQMSRAGTYVVNLDEYNSHLDKNERLPKIVIIIDELADLMLAAKKDIEDRIQNLTQKARAAGIHLVVATQRPSTDVITGVIKSNLATRIAFAVATDVDSRVILDQSGAQKLLGKGDFLYTMQGVNTPVRVQSAFISSEDSQRVVSFIKSNNEAYYDENATAFINKSRAGGGESLDGAGDEIEPVYIEALRYVILSESASISMIQRKCSVGYNKAGKIVEWMEDMGYISSFDGAKARKVLITKEEFESKYGNL